MANTNAPRMVLVKPVEDDESWNDFLEQENDASGYVLPIMMALVYIQDKDLSRNSLIFRYLFRHLLLIFYSKIL